jgi:hypothetical protein
MGDNFSLCFRLGDTAEIEREGNNLSLGEKFGEVE